MNATTTSKQKPVSRDSYYIDLHTVFCIELKSFCEYNEYEVCQTMSNICACFNCIAWYMRYELFLFSEGVFAPGYAECIVLTHTTISKRMFDVDLISMLFIFYVSFCFRFSSLQLPPHFLIWNLSCSRIHKVESEHLRLCILYIVYVVYWFIHWIIRLSRQQLTIELSLSSFLEHIYS